jgi:aminopeptidase
MNIEVYDKYARVLLKIGVDLQPGQDLVLSIPIEAQELAKSIVRIASAEMGARYVKVHYSDQTLEDIKLKNLSSEHLRYFPRREHDYWEQVSEDECVDIRVNVTRVRKPSEIDPERVTTSIKAWRGMMAGYRKNMNAMKVSWLSATIPSLDWARIVYPELDDVSALEALWKDVIKINRLDVDNPVAAWKDHREYLERMRDKLDALNIDRLCFKSPTVDLDIKLVENGKWVGGSVYTANGRNRFMPNIPTEEIFFVPNKYGVNGKVKATAPLNYGSSVIEDIELEFLDGRVTSYRAKTNEELLKGIIETDQGSHYLGEVALVPVSSPIHKSGRIFMNTLYDENAACHLALGSHASAVVKDTQMMSEQELDERGINQSLTHVDFMIGSDQLEVVATDKQGINHQVMSNGEWTI